MAVARDKQPASGGPDYGRDVDPRSESEAARKRNLGPGKQTLAQHLPHMTVQQDHAASEAIRRAHQDKSDGHNDVKTLKDNVHAATQGATAKMSSTVAAASAHPVGHQGAAGHEAHAQEHHRTQAEAHQHAAAAHSHGAGAHGHGADHHDAGHDNPSTHDGVNGIQFKPISDWSKYMPAPMPGQDERERARILKLTQNKIEKERHDAAKQLGQLRQAQIKAAGAVRAMKAGLQSQIAGAQASALGKVASAEAAQAASIQSHVAGVQASVNGSAASARAAVTAAHAATMSQINASAQAATQKLTQGHTQAVQQLTQQEQVQHTVVKAKFTATKAAITALGAAKASQAAGLPNSISLPYSGDKLDAAKKAASDVGSKYAEAMPQQASKAGDDLGTHEPETQKGVSEVSKQIKEKLTEAFKAATDAVKQTKEAAVKAANQVKTGALQQIDQTARSTCASLGAFGAQQVAGIHSSASSAKAGISKAGAAAIASTGKAVDAAANGLTKGAKGLADGAKDVELADPEETKKTVAKQATELKQSVSSITSGMHKSAGDASKGLSTSATSAASGMTQAAGAANSQASQMGSSATQGISQMAQGASANLKQVGDGAKKQLDKTVEEATKGFEACTKGQAHAYSEQATKLQSGLDGAVKNVSASFDKAVPTKETEDILANAKKAADAVKPWWQQALAFVVSIVVAIVVVVAVTALIAVTGPVGMILVGALAGALSTVLSTMASNLILGNGLFDGITLESVALGAVGGAIGGGISGAIGKGVLGSTVAKTMTFAEGGLEGLGGMAVRTGINTAAGMVSDAGAQLIVTGHYEFSMQNLVTTLVSSAATSSKSFDAFSKSAGDSLRTSVGMQPLHLDVNPGSVGGASEGGASSSSSHSSGPTPASDPAGPATSHAASPAAHEPAAAPAAHDNAPAAPHDASPPAHEPAAAPAAHDNAPAAPHDAAAPIADNKTPGRTNGAPNENGPAPHENAPAPTENKAGAPRESGPAPHENAPAPTENKTAAPHENGPAPAADKPGAAPAENKPNAASNDNAHAPENKAAPAQDAAPAPSENKAGPAHDSAPAPHDAAAPESKPAAHEPAAESAPGGEHESAAAAADGAMNELGYPNATSEERVNAEAKLRSNEPPAEQNLRDTEANQRGRQELEANQQGTPEERAALNEKVANELAAKSEPTGTLDQDVASAKAKQAAEQQQTQTKGTAPETTTEPAGGKKPAVDMAETGAEGSTASDGSKRASPEEVLRQRGMSEEDIKLVKGALTKDAQASRGDLNNKMGDGSVKEPLTPQEKAALIKAHDILLQDVTEGQTIRKFVGPDQVGDMLHGQTVDRKTGAVIPADKVGGDIALPRNTDGMNHEQTVHQVGLDYEHNPSGADAGKTKSGTYTDLDANGNVSVSQQVLDNGLHYLEQPMSKAQADAAQVPLAHDLFELSQRPVEEGGSVNPDRFKLKNRDGHQDNPYAGTGATSPNQLEGFQTAMNQELNAGTHAIVEGAQLKVRGEVAGADQTVATYKNGRWELSPDLPPEKQAYYEGLIDKAEQRTTAAAAKNKPGN